MPNYDVDKLREMWVEERRSSEELATEFDVHIATIYRRLNRHNIDRDRRVQFNTIGRGYEELAEPGEGGERVYVHRLLAVAEHGFDAVVGKVIHHNSRVRWDNRPSNFQVVTRKEHKTIHAPESGTNN